MTQFSPILKYSRSEEIWLSQLFSTRAAEHGGVVRRRAADVERRIGRVALEVEVRRRGYHMVECGGQFIIFCDPGEAQLIC